MFGWHLATSIPTTHWHQVPKHVQITQLLSDHQLEHCLARHPERLSRMQALIQPIIPIKPLVDIVMSYHTPPPFLIDMTHDELLAVYDDPTHALCILRQQFLEPYKATNDKCPIRSIISKFKLTGLQCCIYSQLKKNAKFTPIQMLCTKHDICLFQTFFRLVRSSTHTELLFPTTS